MTKNNNYRIGYKVLNNAILNNKISHAYLFVGEDLNLNQIALNFSKKIFCLENKENLSSVSQRIDSGNYTELMIISPENGVIKKEKIIELQNDFSRKAIEGKKKIYIIEDCDKLNKSSANSILKFIEEPEEGIIGILLSNNLNDVLKTISSRCQIIKFNKKTDLEEIENNLKLIEEEEFGVFLEIIEKYEEDGFEEIMVNKKYNSFFSDKKTATDIVNAFLLIYSSCYEIKNKDFNNTSKGFVKLKKIAKNINLSIIVSRIKYLGKIKKEINENLNLALLFDKMFIEMEENINA